jgi:tetratricopeptide (TPR) repeat protein
MGLCIVLDVDGSKVRTYSERGRYGVDVTHAQLVEASPGAAIFPGAAERLHAEYANHQRRKQVVAYTDAMRRGLDAMHRADYGWAIDMFSEALAIEPDSHEALSARAYCRRMVHAHAGAIEDYTRLLHEGAASDENYLERALCSEALGRLDEACTDAEAALGINENKAQACDLLARVHLKLAQLYAVKAQHHETRARQIRNPEGNLGPLFE